MADIDTVLDGTAIAGDLQEIFCVDLTIATATCNFCGRVAPFPESRVYATQPGIVVRCSTCEQPLMRIVRSPNRSWIDLRGLRVLDLMTPRIDGEA